MNPSTSKHVLHHACTIAPSRFQTLLALSGHVSAITCHDYFIPVPLTCPPGLAYISPRLRGRPIIWAHTLLVFTHSGTHRIHKLLPGKVLWAQYDCRHSQVHLFLLCLCPSQSPWHVPSWQVYASAHSLTPLVTHNYELCQWLAWIPWKHCQPFNYWSLFLLLEAYFSPSAPQCSGKAVAFKTTYFSRI